MSKIPENVVDKALYSRVKNKLKKQMTWPSAYASGQLVKQYKAAGGRYKGRKPPKNTGLQRWYEQEEWVNVCKPKKKGKYQPCGRPSSKMSKREYTKSYPYCRPLKRATKSTPKTVGEFTKKELKKRCTEKKKNPKRRVR